MKSERYILPLGFAMFRLQSHFQSPRITLQGTCAYVAGSSLWDLSPHVCLRLRLYAQLQSKLSLHTTELKQLSLLTCNPVCRHRGLLPDPHTTHQKNVHVTW